jgi:beta-lactamase class A
MLGMSSEQLKKSRLCTLYLFLLTVSCTNINSSSRENISSGQPNVLNKNTTSSINSRTKLSGQIEQISQAAQGRVGVTAMMLETGESVTLNGNQRFPMQSVYKFPIAMAVLAKVDRGKLKLDQKIRVETSDIVQGSQILDEKSQGMELRLDELLKYMVSESDNTACDVLLRLVGKPKIVTDYMRSLGINDIVVAYTEKELAQNATAQYRNDATPDAVVALLR